VLGGFQVSPVAALQCAQEFGPAGGRKALEKGLEQPLDLFVSFVEPCRRRVVPGGHRCQETLEFRIQAKAARRIRASSSVVMSPCHRASLS